MIISDLKSKEIEKYPCEGLIINSKEFSTFNDITFSFVDLYLLVDKIHSLHKLAYLCIDKIIEEDELSSLEEYLMKVKEFEFDGYIVGDLGALNLIKKIDSNAHIIFDSKTLITNYYDALFYMQQDIDVVIANELTMEEIKSILKAQNGVIEVFGYHQIFYSRRLLFDAYEKYMGTNYELKNKLNYLQEETRNQLYPIYQSDKGTFIYNAFVFKMFSELKEIQNDVKIIRINGSFLDEQTLISVIVHYNELLLTNCIDDIKRLEAQFEALNLKFTNGFLYQKSILLKEKNNE